MTKYFKNEFAVNGDKVGIPNDMQASGEVSYQTGFGIDYQRKLGTDVLAKPFPRQGFNGLMADLTGAVQQYQQNGFFDFITPEMNGGKVFEYAMGATVRYDMSGAKDGSNVKIFCSKIPSNTGSPSDNPSDWLELTNLNIFATNEEAQEQQITGKAIDPATLGSVTATTIRHGLIQIATAEEVKDKTNTKKAVPPAYLPEAIKGEFSNNLLSDNGYQILPSGLIMQWGNVQTTQGTNMVITGATFPITFTSKCLCIVANFSGDAAFIILTGNTRSNFTAKVVERLTNDTVNAGTMTWYALGY